MLGAVLVNVHVILSEACDVCAVSTFCCVLKQCAASAADSGNRGCQWRNRLQDRFCDSCVASDAAESVVYCGNLLACLFLMTVMVMGMLAMWLSAPD